MCSTKYVRSDGIYDTLFGLSMSFTNYRVSLHKLLDEDWALYNRYRKRLTDIGDSFKRKRADSQTKYERKREHRLNIGHRVNILSGNENEETD